MIRWDRIGIDADLDYLHDSQMANPFGFCCVCGREIYRPFTETCDRCRMDTDIIEEEEE